VAWAILAGALFLVAGVAGVWGLARTPAAGLLGACAAALAGHGVLLGLLAPSLSALWLSSRTTDVLDEAGDTPLEGVIQGPVAVDGYAEPSLVFLLGADTQLGGPQDAARAIAQGRAAIVEGRDQAAFAGALQSAGVQARQIGEVFGLDYSKGRHDILRVYLPESPPKEAS
jgi:hypothetical protein